ncbi:MAG: ABC transporter permease [Gammaproteobacteria bacterium]|nr:ABC transporter permease [Gammaproteobacteria bacterium]
MLELAIAFLVKSTVILALALSICCLKRLSAAERHAVAGASLVAVTVLALLTLLPDRVRVPEWSVTLPVIPIEAAPPLAGIVNTPAAPAAATVVSSASPAETIDWRFWAFSIYGIVATALGLSTLGGRRRVANYVRRLPLWRGCAFAPDTIDVRADVGGTPWTWGHVRPVVVLPRDFDNWPRHQQDAVLAHELGHIRRRDCLTDGLSRWLCNLFWFQPLMWVVWLRQRRYAEEACDNAALESGADPCDYAETLLAVARRNHQAKPMGLYAGRGNLRARLRSILHRGTRRNRMTFAKRGLLLAGAMAVLLAASACSVTMAGIEDADQVAVESPAGEVVHDIFVYISRFRRGMGPTPEEARYLADRLTNVSRASPIYVRNLEIRRGHQEVEASLIAMRDSSPRAEFSGLAVWPLEQGEYISAQDHHEGRRVAVIGGPVRDQLFSAGEPVLGQEIVIHGQPFRIKGVLASHPPFVEFDPPDPEYAATALARRVYVPFHPGTEMFFEGVRPIHLRVAVHDQARVTETATEIRDLLQARYGDAWEVFVETLTIPSPDGA